MALPDWLAAMVRRNPPQCGCVIVGSTPVVAFGHTSANVATIGINPSSAEFVDVDAKLWTGDARRLATLASLGAKELAKLSDRQVETVVNECVTYFERQRDFFQGGRDWFKDLENLLRDGVRASYYKATACHLDLIQWATDPVWGGIKEPNVRRQLLDDGVPHLRAQLSQGKYRLILLNGAEVIEQVQAAGLVKLSLVEDSRLAGFGCKLHEAKDARTVWLGWSTNLQSSWGVSNELRARLTEWVRDADARLRDPVRAVPPMKRTKS